MDLVVKRFGGNVQNSKVMNGMQLLVVELDLLQQQVVHFVVGTKRYDFTDSNSNKKWRGFYNSLSQTELQDEWDYYWNT